MSTRSITIGSGPGTTKLDVGVITDLQLTRRNGTSFEGISTSDLAALLRVIDFTLTPVPDATYSWNTTALNLAVTHADANVDITLPDATQVTNWVPGDPPRRVFTMNSSAFGWDLLAPADVSINGGPLGTDMQPVPDSNTAPSPTALGQWVYVYRQTAAAYWVWGGA